MMKYFLCLWMCLTVAAIHAGDFDDPGWISGWSFSPLQIDTGFIQSRKLVDETTDTFLSLGVFTLQQKSAVLSVGMLANLLQNNYGLQIAALFLGTATDNNYGISFGVDNYCKRCYGIQLGILNHSWGGKEIKKETEFFQFCGANIADTVYLGVVNVADKFQIGLFNIGQNGATLQIGLLNYNPKSYIPWLPLINFDMGKR